MEEWDRGEWEREDKSPSGRLSPSLCPPSLFPTVCPLFIVFTVYSYAGVSTPAPPPFPGLASPASLPRPRFRPLPPASRPRFRLLCVPLSCFHCLFICRCKCPLPVGCRLLSPAPVGSPFRLALPSGWLSLSVGCRLLSPAPVGSPFRSALPSGCLLRLKAT